MWGLALAIWFATSKLKCIWLISLIRLTSWHLYSILKIPVQAPHRSTYKFWSIFRFTVYSLKFTFYSLQSKIYILESPFRVYSLQFIHQLSWNFLLHGLGAHKPSGDEEMLAVFSFAPAGLQHTVTRLNSGRKGINRNISAGMAHS